MTGMPHRPSSIDGQSSVFAFVSSYSNPIGLAQKIARRSRSPLSGYAYRLGRCGDWRTDD
jgi:hypothetical protein